MAGIGRNFFASLSLIRPYPVEQIALSGLIHNSGHGTTFRASQKVDNMVAIVIIPADLAASAEEVVKQLAPTSDGSAFVVALRELTGTDNTPTHLACLPIVSSFTCSLISQRLSMPPFMNRCVMRTCDPTESLSAFQQACSELGLEQIFQET